MKFSMKRVLARYLRSHIKTRYKVSKLYLAGDGIEIGALHNPLPVSAKVKVRYVDKWSREELYRIYPELSKEDIVVSDLVDDGERLSKVPSESLDFIVANHFIEHCENPVATILNFFDKLKPGGIVYMAVPDKRFTFDSVRGSTSLDHLENDHSDGGAGSRAEHYLEYARCLLANQKARESEIATSAEEMMKMNYSIHFHVWSYHEFVEFLHWLKTNYLHCLDIVETVLNGKEGIYILRKNW